MATATNNRAAAANRNHNSITPSNMRLPDLTSLLFQSTTITDDLALTKGIVPRKVINLTEQPPQIDAIGGREQRQDCMQLERKRGQQVS